MRDRQQKVSAASDLINSLQDDAMRRIAGNAPLLQYTHQSGTRLQITNIAGQRDKKKDNSSLLGQPVDLIDHLNRESFPIVSYPIQRFYNFISYSTIPSLEHLSPVRSNDRKHLPEYLRSAFKVIHRKLCDELPRPIDERRNRKEPIDENETKSLLLHIAIGRFYSNHDFLQARELRDWIDTDGTLSPFIEQLKDVRDSVLNFKDICMPLNRRRASDLQMVIPSTMNNCLVNLTKDLDWYKGALQIWGLMWAVSVQTLVLPCDNGDIRTVREETMGFLGSVQSRVQAAKLLMESLDVEIIELMLSKRERTP